MSLLLLYGANVAQLDSRGRTALHCASSRLGASQVVAILLAAGVEVDAKDLNNHTSLYIAASAGDDRSVLLLLQYGATVDYLFVESTS